MCNSARAMMMALGCIQALECNKNSCPTGVATQDPTLVKGLVIEDKKHRVANFHKHTMEGFVELMASAGIDHPSGLNRHQISRRVFMNKVATLEEIYPSVPVGSMLGSEMPERYKMSYASASAEKF